MKLSSILILLGAASGCAIDGELTRRYLRPTRDCIDRAGQHRLAAEGVRFPAEDGTQLRGWLAPGDGSGRAVILFHGPGVAAGDTFGLVAPLARAGFDVLTFDYRGFGESDGDASMVRLLEDGRAAYRFVTVERNVPPERVALYGASVGAIPASAIAAEEPCAALLLEGALETAEAIPRDLGSTFTWWAETFGDSERWSVRENARRIQCPVLALHGERDPEPPPIDAIRTLPHDEKQLRQVAGAGPPPEPWLVDERETRSLVVRFLDDAFARRETMPYRALWSYERGSGGSEVVVAIIGPLGRKHEPIEAILVYPTSGLVRRRGFLDGGLFEFREPAREGLVAVLPSPYAKVIERNGAWEEDRRP